MGSISYVHPELSELGRRVKWVKQSTAHNVYHTAIAGPLPLPNVKRYFEVEVIADVSATGAIGLGNKIFGGTSQATYPTYDHYVWRATTGIYRNNNNQLDTPANAGTWAAGDNIGVAYDPTAGTIWFRKNGTWAQGWNPATPTGGYTGITSGSNYERANTMMPLIELNTNYSGVTTWDYRLRARAGDLVYGIPSGFSAWDTEDIPDPIAKEFQWIHQYFGEQPDATILPDGTARAGYLDQDLMQHTSIPQYHRGTDYVDGYVDVAGVPAQRKVRLYDDQTGHLIAATWSDATTGYFRFEGVSSQRVYMVVGNDYTRTYDAVAHDYLKST
jgi:hypothetical protein